MNNINDFLESLSEAERKEIMSVLNHLGTDDQLKRFIIIVYKYKNKPHTLTASERNIAETFLRFVGPLPTPPPELLP